MSSFFRTGGGRGSIIKLALFIIAAILLLAYLGYDLQDVREHPITLMIKNLFVGFFN